MSERELCILATTVEEINQKYSVNPMHELMCLQVVLSSE